jgi:hypothetical protein
LFDFDFTGIACRVTQLLFICCCLGGVLIRGSKSRQFQLTNQLSRYLCYLHSCFYWRTNSLPGFLTDWPVFFHLSQLFWTAVQKALLDYDVSTRMFQSFWVSLSIISIIKLESFPLLNYLKHFSLFFPPNSWISIFFGSIFVTNWKPILKLNKTLKLINKRQGQADAKREASILKRRQLRRDKHKE